MKNLCNAYVINLNERSKFSGFEIVTMREVEANNGGVDIIEIKTYEEFLSIEEISLDEPFYRINGLYKQSKKKKSFGDFYQISHAVDFLEELTGLSVYIYSM